MAKAQLPKTGFFGTFQTSDDDNSLKSDLNDDDEILVDDKKEEEKEPEKVEDKKEEFTKEDKPEDLEKEVEDKEEEELDEDDPFIDTINYLASKGIISFDEDKTYEEEGEELLEKVFQETIERDRQEWIEEIPEDFRSIIKHLKAGGNLEDWIDAIKTTDFDSIDLENVDNQKALIEDHLLMTGMDEDDIKERLQELEDLGTLEKNAKTAVKYLKKAEEGKAKAHEAELEKAIKAQEKEELDRLEDFKKTVLATEKLKDFELDKTERQSLLDHITKSVNKKGESQYVINQKSLENQLLLAYMDQKGFTLKDIQKRAETKAASGLRKSLSKITDDNAKGLQGKSAKVPVESNKIPKGPWG